MKRCRNCKSDISEEANYCNSCGQKYTKGKVKVWSFLTEFVDSIFSFESRTFKTLVGLFQPGFLTKEFFEGRQIRYIHPLRIFLFSTTILLAVLGFKINKDVIPKADKLENGISTRIAQKDLIRFIDSLDYVIVEKSFSDSSLDCRDDIEQELLNLSIPQRQAENTELPFLEGVTEGKVDYGESKEVNNGTAYYEPRDGSLNYKLYKSNSKNSDTNGETSAQDSSTSNGIVNIDLSFNDFYKIVDDISSKKIKNESSLEGVDTALYNAITNPDKLIQKILGYTIWVILFILITTALLMKLLYLRHEKYLVEHLAFTLHFQAFMFWLCIPLIWFYNEVPNMGFFITGLIWLYLLIAMKVFYNQGKRKTLIKFILILFYYIIITIIAIAALLGAGFFG